MTALSGTPAVRSPDGRSGVADPVSGTTVPSGATSQASSSASTGATGRGGTGGTTPGNRYGLVAPSSADRSVASSLAWSPVSTTAATNRPPATSAPATRKVMPSITPVRGSTTAARSAGRCGVRGLRAARGAPPAGTYQTSGG